MENQLKEGHVGVLKSGGPKMTIELIEDEMASCIWFDGKEPKQHHFKLILLKHPDPIAIF